MDIDYKLQLLRANLRKNSKIIIDKVINDDIVRSKGKHKHKSEICMFCGSTNNITKEHVIPRWLFENRPEKFFTTNINELNQTYTKTTIPACLTCNSNLLNTVEKYILELFAEIELPNDFFTDLEIQNIIRWLEIIDYKFQILNVRRKFVASKSGGYIPYLADFPLSVLRPEKDYSPSSVLAEIRRSQKRITVKTKTQSINSLIVFKTSNSNFHFFHKMDDFIFLELPKQKIAIFCFYKLQFRSAEEAHTEAMKIIDAAY